MEDALVEPMQEQLRLACTWGALFATRLLPIVTFSPAFGGELAPRRFRFALAVLLTVPFAATADASGLRHIDGLTLAMLFAKEALVGAVLAALVVVLFEAFAAAGALADVARGASMASVLDPMAKQQSSPLAMFMRQFTMVMFLTAGGYGLLVTAMAGSVRAMPVDVLMPAALIGPEAMMGIISLAADLTLVAAQLVMPVLIAVLAVDVAAGLVSRSAPQIEMYTLALPARMLIGLLVVAVTFDPLREWFEFLLGQTLAAIAGGGA